MGDPTTQHVRSRNAVAWFALGVLPFLALVVARWHLGPFSALGDWSHYMLHADALYHGRSYTDTGYIFTSLNPFIGPQAQPPGLPAVLAALMAVAGGTHDLAIYRLAMVAFGLLFLGSAFLYIRRRSGVEIATATIMVVGLWLETGYVTNAVQPDVGFSAFLWIIFAIADRPGAWRRRDIIAVTVLGLAALGFRTAALPLVPALALYALLKRREIGWGPMIPVAVWCACGLAAAVAVPDALTFARVIAGNPGRLFASIGEALRVYPFAAMELFLYPFPGDRVNDIYHVMCAGFAAIGAVRWVRAEYRTLPALFVVCYGGLLAVFPMQDTRYLMPLAPLVVYAMWLGVVTTARWIAARSNHSPESQKAGRVTVVAAGAIAAIALVVLLRQPSPVPLLDAPGVRSIFSLLRNEHARAPVRAVFVNPRVLTWETGVPAMGFFRASPDSTLAEFRAKRITHVVVGDVDTDSYHAPSIAQAVTERPQAFRSVFAEGPFTVFRFDSTRVQQP
jgi:hypothetical protein